MAGWSPSSPVPTSRDRRVRRVLNGLRKVASGLRPFNESVWPGVENDLFVAHRSIYAFAAPLARDGDVLDAGCGTGYGTHELARAGARSVLGVDVDRLSVAFARRHYRHPRLAFRVADCETLAVAPGSLDLVFSSNVLEHLEEPEAFLGAAFAALRPGGRALLAVPPITTAEALGDNQGIHYHRSNLFLSEWHALLSTLPWSLTLFAHRPPEALPAPDFGSPFPSTLRPGDFRFEPSTLEEAHARVPLTAVFLAEKRAA